MTIQEHVKYLVEQAENDLGASEALKKAGYYAHALFWGHLVLEKVCKALYLQNNKTKDYPHIHNLIILLGKSSVELSEEQITFYSDMNRFQSKGRYTNTLQEIEATVTKEICEKYFEKLKTELTWLKNQLQ